MCRERRAPMKFVARLSVAAVAALILFTTIIGANAVATAPQTLLAGADPIQMRDRTIFKSAGCAAPRSPHRLYESDCRVRLQPRACRRRP